MTLSETPDLTMRQAIAKDLGVLQAIPPQEQTVEQCLVIMAIEEATRLFEVSRLPIDCPAKDVDLRPGEVVMIDGFLTQGMHHAVTSLLGDLLARDNPYAQDSPEWERWAQAAFTAAAQEPWPSALEGDCALDGYMWGQQILGMKFRDVSAQP